MILAVAARPSSRSRNACGPSASKALPLALQRRGCEDPAATMTIISNTTNKPLSVPLPGGGRLFLGPGKTGQIVSSAVEHPPLKTLIDAGSIAIASENMRGSHPTINDKIGHGSAARGSTGGARRSGDR